MPMKGHAAAQCIGVRGVILLLGFERIGSYYSHLFVEIVLDRMGLPAEMGKTAVFLASADSSFVVETEILAEGGMTNISLMQ